MKLALLAIMVLDVNTFVNAKILGNVVPLQVNANVLQVGKETTAVSHVRMVHLVFSAKKTVAV